MPTILISKTKETDGVLINDFGVWADILMKNKALQRYENFSVLTASDQNSTSLGMNSILDLRNDYEQAQPALLTYLQRCAYKKDQIEL